MRFVKILGLRVWVIAVYAKLMVVLMVGGRMLWIKARTVVYVLIIIGGREGSMPGCCGGVSAAPGTKFVVHTAQRSAWRFGGKTIDVKDNVSELRVRHSLGEGGYEESAFGYSAAA